jgi:hypothetical protein
MGIAWAAIDLTAFALLFQLMHSGSPLVELIGWSWQGILLAKVLLLLGWFFLGSGPIQNRLSGLLVFAPLLLCLLIMALPPGGFPEVLGFLFCISLLAIPGSFLVGLPYLLLRANDQRLVQGIVERVETRRQFTVRQLLLVTLAAAIVLGLLRAAGQVDPQSAMMASLFIVLPWLFPLLSCVGFLSRRWNKVTLGAAAVAAFQIALPLYAFDRERAWEPVIFVSCYTVFFACHLLLIRRLGFRLIDQRRLRFTDEIKFIEPDGTGIAFLDTEAVERFE